MKTYDNISILPPGWTALRILLTVMSIVLTLSMHAQWMELGSGADGEADGDISGIAVALSGDGSMVAVGALSNDADGTDRGHVRVFSNLCGIWSQVGQDIDGEGDGDAFGWSVSMSADGSTVAIGAPNNAGNGSNSGHVRVFKLMSGLWSQLGADIDGEAAGDNSGYSVSLSADGLRVAIGAYLNAGGGSFRGHTRVYQYSGGSWSQLGTDIDGEGDYDTSGESVAISADGSTVAIGALGNSGGGSSSGHVRVYKYVSGSWVQQGNDIDGEAASHYSGKSVTLSSDGTLVAIGAPFDVPGNFKGYVKVFKLISGTWVQQGQKIEGEAEGDYSGISVSLSGNGSVVAIGGYFNAGGGTIRGHVRVYKNQSGSWTQIGADIDGEEDFETLGFSVSISTDGNTVASAGPYYSSVGPYRGRTRVYSVEDCPPPIAVCGVMTVYVDPNNPEYDGPGNNNIWWIPGLDLDAGSYSSSQNHTLNVRRHLSQITFDWTTAGACLDVTPNGSVNNNDKGIVYRDCLPVRNADFNIWRLYQLRVQDQWGTSACFGAVKVVPAMPAFQSVPVIHAILPASTEPAFAEELLRLAEHSEISTVADAEVIDIYPNPGKDVFQLSWNSLIDEEVSIRISDMAGNIISQNHYAVTHGQNLFLFDMNRQSSGMYIVFVQSSQIQHSLKWMKMSK